MFSQLLFCGSEAESGLEDAVGVDGCGLRGREVDAIDAEPCAERVFSAGQNKGGHIGVRSVDGVIDEDISDLVGGGVAGDVELVNVDDGAAETDGEILIRFDSDLFGDDDVAACIDRGDECRGACFSSDIGGKGVLFVIEFEDGSQIGAERETERFCLSLFGRRGRFIAGTLFCSAAWFFLFDGLDRGDAGEFGGVCRDFAREFDIDDGGRHIPFVLRGDACAVMPVDAGHFIGEIDRKTARLVAIGRYLENGVLIGDDAYAFVVEVFVGAFFDVEMGVFGRRMDGEFDACFLE